MLTKEDARPHDGRALFPLFLRVKEHGCRQSKQAQVHVNSYVYQGAILPFSCGPVGRLIRGTVVTSLHRDMPLDSPVMGLGCVRFVDETAAGVYHALKMGASVLIRSHALLGGRRLRTCCARALVLLQPIRQRIPRRPVIFVRQELTAHAERQAVALGAALRRSPA
jgi:hypothetical protein